MLEFQADQIEMVLYAHGIQAQVTGGVVTPRWVRFDTALAIDQKPEKVQSLQSAIAHRLGADVRIGSEANGRLVIEVARFERRDVTLWQLAAKLPRNTHMVAVLGLGLSDGRPLLLHLPSPDVTHVLVAGMTGSGKTELMRATLGWLAACNEPAIMQLYIIDPQGRWYNDLAWLPHLPLRHITTELDEAADVTGLLVAEMGKRNQSGDIEPRLVLAIDELADLVMIGGPGVLDNLTRLTQRGRGAGIHVIAGTQKPTADAIGSLVKSNFPVRLVGSVATPEDAKIATGLRQTGAERLQGRGDFILCQHGRPERFQAALLDGEFLHHLRRDIRRSGYAGQTDGDPLAEYQKQIKSQLSIIHGGRQDERDAEHVIESPGFLRQYWDGSALGYGHQTAIGEIIQEDNAGAGRKRILRVASLVTQLLTSSTTSTTSTGDS